jgi:hypothetical protein
VGVMYLIDQLQPIQKMMIFSLLKITASFFISRCTKKI